jgi:hypothetical protein
MRLHKDCAEHNMPDECVWTRIVLNLKSSGADSSLLTLGGIKIMTATVVRTLGTACRCLGRMNPLSTVNQGMTGSGKAMNTESTEENGGKRWAENRKLGTQARVPVPQRSVRIGYNKGCWPNARVAFLGAGVDIFGPSWVFLNLHCSAVGPPCVFPQWK